MDKEESEFRSALAEARHHFESGRPNDAIDRVIGVSGSLRYGKDPECFQLLKEMYAWLESRVFATGGTATPQRRKLLFDLYSLWPKVDLEDAILKHDFPEVEISLREKLLGTLEVDAETYARIKRQLNEQIVSWAESVQLAKYDSGFLTKRWGALSRDKSWLKFWDLETGKIIHVEEPGLTLLASAIVRDGSHLLEAHSWGHLGDGSDLNWSTSFKETFRRVSCLRAGTYAKSEYANVRYYKVWGEILSVAGEQTLEMDRASFEKNPIRGEVLPAKEFWREHRPRYQEWIREVYSEAEAEEIFQNNKLKEEREKQIVRVQQYQTVTIAHDDIEGYLPAGTTTFVARSNEYYGLKVDDLRYGARISATLAVEDNESWIEEIIGPGLTLRGANHPGATTPITEVCISSDGSLALRNGNGENFGIWNLWTGDRLREFQGHTDRVTCLCFSVDVSFVVSGSEDKTLRLWKPITAECLRVFQGHENPISKVCISLDATKILSADRGGVIKLWDLATGECLRTILAHDANISGLHFMFDGKFAASSSWDKTVKVWNLTDGRCMKTLEHTDWATSVDMTPDGRYLVSSSYGGTKVWELIWRLEPHDVAEWDEGARPYLEILMNANAAWDGKLGTPVDMSEEEIKNTLRRQSPSWTAWHEPSNKNDWHRVWHLGWDIEETLGHAGYGWLSEGPGRECSKIMDAWKEANPR